MQTNESGSNALRPYRAGFVFSFFNSTTWMVALGTPALLLAESLGASTFEIGLLYSFVFMLLPVQVMATATLPRFGYRTQTILPGQCGLCFYSFHLALFYLFQPGKILRGKLASPGNVPILLFPLDGNLRYSTLVV